MTHAVLSPRAQRDIETIWNFTCTTWGAEQAEAYVRRLKTAVELIAGNPQLGRACSEVRQGYQKYPCGSHFLFYRLVDGGVDVKRILHQSMDFRRHV